MDAARVRVMCSSLHFVSRGAGLSYLVVVVGLSNVYNSQRFPVLCDSSVAAPGWRMRGAVLGRPPAKSLLRGNQFLLSHRMLKKGFPSEHFSEDVMHA